MPKKPLQHTLKALNDKPKPPWNKAKGLPGFWQSSIFMNFDVASPWIWLPILPSNLDLLVSLLKEAADIFCCGVALAGFLHAPLSCSLRTAGATVFNNGSVC